MTHAREQSFAALRHIASCIHPGMTEELAQVLADCVLREMGMDRLWHPNTVRFGAGTLKTFKERSDPARVLGSHDIFFIDLGPVWGGHEGHAGATFVVGDDMEMRACADAARTLWYDVAGRWRHDRLSGRAIYRYAEQRATAMGWRLNPDIHGHRVGEFPTAGHLADDLAGFGRCPSGGLWILGIQIAHPTRPFGACHEDLLSEDGDG